MVESYNLSEGIINFLVDKGIFLLHHIKDHNEDWVGGRRWKNTHSLDLNSQYVTEWDNYTKSLRRSGIYLDAREDHLLWSWNTSNGVLSSKLAYESIIYESHNIVQNWWYRSI